MDLLGVGTHNIGDVCDEGSDKTCDPSNDYAEDVRDVSGQVGSSLEFVDDSFTIRASEHICRHTGRIEWYRVVLKL